MPFFFLSYFLFECFKVFLYSSSFRVCIYLLHHIYYFLIFPFRLYCWRCEFRHRRDHLLLLLLFPFFYIIRNISTLRATSAKKKIKPKKIANIFCFLPSLILPGFFSIVVGFGHSTRRPSSFSCAGTPFFSLVFFLGLWLCWHFVGDLYYSSEPREMK